MTPFPIPKRKPGIIIAGPSGVGKATLCLMLLVLFPEKFAVVGSYTTRAAKEEKHGKIYIHCTHEEFAQYLLEGKIMESNNYTGKNLYGTSRESYDEIIKSGKIPLFDVDLNGAQQLRNLLPQDDLLSFFLDCEIDELERRLIGRNAETLEQIKDRLKTGAEELALAPSLVSLKVINKIIPYGVGADAEKQRLISISVLMSGIKIQP